MRPEESRLHSFDEGSGSDSQKSLARLIPSRDSYVVVDSSLGTIGRSSTSTILT